MNNIKNFKSILSKQIEKSNKVLIVPHIYPDFDAVGSSVGLVNICRKFNKDSYILINEDFTKMESSINEMILEVKEQYNVVNVEQYLKMMNQMDLMIATDVNKNNLIAIKDYLNTFKTKIVIDHHLLDQNTINTEYKYIDSNVSSASEIISMLLNLYNIDFDSKCANYLYAGIILDTNNLQKNISYNTLNIASKLIKKGADIKYINRLFIEDFEQDRKIHKLIDHSIFKNFNYAIAAGKDTIYSKNDLAKAANYILKYNVDASFAIGLLASNLIGISSRSNGNINVGRILSFFGGGGSMSSAATTIEGNDIEHITQKLEHILTLKNNK